MYLISAQVYTNAGVHFLRFKKNWLNLYEKCTHWFMG